MEAFEWVLLVAAFLTSILSGVMGMGGGILLLAVMAQYFPLATLIPLHAFVQLGSNTSRAIYNFRFLNFKIIGLYGLGAVGGVLIGSQLIVKIPEPWYKIGLGLFILFITFVPLPRFKKSLKFKWPFVGAGATFLSLFVGATGPVIAPFFLTENLQRQSLIATKAACQFFTHTFKIITFFLIGFSLGPHLWLVLGMVLMVILGNYIGKLILHKISEKWFFILFKSLIFILAVRSILIGFKKWFFPTLV